MIPNISYIISYFNKPYHLCCFLCSLKIQTDQNFEAFIIDNTPDPTEGKRMVEFLNDPRFIHVHANLPNCYYGGNFGVTLSKGQYICFPSEDGYYVPEFGEIMYNHAVTNSLDLVYCNMLYDKRLNGLYSVLDVAPVKCRIDKSSFIMKRELFTGFSLNPKYVITSDGRMIEDLVKRGIKHGKVDHVLLAHN